MKNGYLSEYFEGVSFKRLSAVDAEPKKSNQHEIGTTKKIRLSFLGEREEKFKASYIWFLGENETIIEYGDLTHYDSRKNNKDRSPEWRLYYTSNAVTELMSEGDSLFLAKPRIDNTLLFIIAKPNSTEEAQLKWLFGIEGQLPLRFESISTDGNSDYELDFTATSILEEIGVELEDPKSNEIDNIIHPYLDTFPSTAEFSQKARLTLPEVEARDDPDRAIMLWLEHEDKMFKRLEQNIIEKRLQKGFVKNNKPDVDEFLKFSGSIRQRRFSRMGLSLENHLAAVFDAFDLQYTRTAQTENKTKPDFLFPSENQYWDTNFPKEKLVMMGSKSTCKDRWRQVLSEASKIPNKHLFTLQPSITENQTDEMKANNLQLILPKSIHSSYKPEQKAWLMSLSEFISFVQGKQT
jgi:hypothetical protein